MVNKKRIPITKLEPGQYVIDISQQLGHMKVTASGWVRSQQAVDELIAKGIVSVTIDPDQQLYSKEDKPLEFDQEFGKVSFEMEAEAANKAIEKLTETLSLSFQLIRNEDLFDVNQLHLATMEFIASSYRNPAVVLSKMRVTFYKDHQLGHALRTAAYFSAMLRFLKWPPDIAQGWIMGALLHDIGNLVMSPSIQNPNAKTISEAQRTKDEFSKPEHVSKGIEIAEYVGSLMTESMEVIAMHHERLDGSGYPTGQKLTDLNDAIRIFCIIDEFDRLTRTAIAGAKPVGVLQAFRKMLKMENQFDFEMLQRFIKCIGVYPPGTLVKLKSGKVGLVLDNNGSSVRPNIKVIYNAKLNHHVPSKVVDLSETPNDDIEGLFYGNKIGIYSENYL